MKERPRSSLQPPDYDLPVAAAIQAVAAGNASADQQMRALQWIIEEACGTYQPSYRPNSDETIFAEGRRFAGLQIVKLIKLRTAVLVRSNG